MVDSIEIGMEVRNTSIDPETFELVVEWYDTLSDTKHTSRIGLERALDVSDAEHTQSIPMDCIDVSGPQEYLSDLHNVSPDNILIKRIEEPNEVHYDIRE